jgi:hypothetical protein
MTKPMLNDKITPQHLDRRAVIYLRQSSEKQVRENTESQRLQYGLRDRAVALGWTQVEVIDIDLGRSASLGARSVTALTGSSGRSRGARSGSS